MKTSSVVILGAFTLCGVTLIEQLGLIMHQDVQTDTLVVCFFGMSIFIMLYKKNEKL